MEDTLTKRIEAARLAKEKLERDKQEQALADSLPDLLKQQREQEQLNRAEDEYNQALAEVERAVERAAAKTPGLRAKLETILSMTAEFMNESQAVRNDLVSSLSRLRQAAYERGVRNGSIDPEIPLFDGGYGEAKAKALAGKDLEIVPEKMAGRLQVFLPSFQRFIDHIKMKP